MKRVAILTASLCICGFANAEPYHGVGFVGGTISDDDSAYTGGIFALPGAVLGRGFAVKLAAHGGRYDYVGGPGKVDAKYYGGRLALVHQWSGDWGWANFSVGADATQTDLSPGDPANKRAGFRLDVSLGVDGALNLNERWRAGLYSEGGVRDESYLVRLDTTRSMNAGRWRLGMEGAIQGDPTYQIKKVGAVASVTLKKDLEARFSGGAAFKEDQNAQPYVSIGLSVLF